IHILDFVARNQLSDTVLMEEMSKLFGPRQDVTVVDPLIWDVVERGQIAVPTEQLRSLFTGIFDQKMLLPVNCSDTHWCALMV
ncbi:hypothetical protein PPTG_21728, partial [Phytophthora nicotianae INRA-310]